MTWTAYACQTTTGQILGRLDGSPDQWTRALNSAETGGIKIESGAIDPKAQPGGSIEKRELHRRLTTPWLMSLVLDWDGTVIWAGPFTARSADSDLSAPAVGLKTLLTRRKAISQTAPYASQTISPSNTSYAGTAAQLLATATDPAKAGAQLPIVVPTGETDNDASHARTYRGYDLVSISDALDELTGAAGGPDIDFAPEWTDATRTAIRWVTRAGSLAQPRLQGATTFAFDGTQPGASVQSLTVTEDAGDLATTQWGKGAGSAQSTLMAMSQDSTLTSLGWPLLEQETDYTETQLNAVLAGQVAGDLEQNRAPIVQWGMSVWASGSPQLGTYRPGDLCRVNVRAHWWIPDGEYAMRILSISGDGGPTVTLGLQAASLRGASVLGTLDQTVIGRLARLERGA